MMDDDIQFRRFLSVATLVGLANLITGIVVIVSPTALEAVPVSMLHTLVAASLWETAIVSGPVLITTGLMALAAANLHMNPFWRFALIMPQQGVLLLQIWGITQTLIVGAYPDGYVPDGEAWDILADQIWAWLICVTHTLEVMAIFAGRTRGN